MLDKPVVPPNVDVLVLPGLAGKPHTTDEDSVYPGVTTDVVKLLREMELRVDYWQPRESRKTIVRKGADIWIPILLFTEQVVANGGGTLLANAVTQLLGKRAAERSVLHVKCGAASGEGQVEWFEAHGPGTDVLKALRQFKGKRGA